MSISDAADNQDVDIVADIYDECRSLTSWHSGYACIELCADNHYSFSQACENNPPANFFNFVFDDSSA